jgi:hypothetical protein
MQAINWSWCLWVARPSPLRSFVVQLPHERKTSPSRAGRSRAPNGCGVASSGLPCAAMLAADRNHATARARWPGHTNTRSVPWSRCEDKHSPYAREQAGCACGTTDIMRRR